MYGFYEVKAGSLNIKQIRYFTSVFTHGSLSAAAKEQYVTVQAVSKAIADLERELKCDLFVRESRGVRPTPFGKIFHVKAESVLKGFDELEDFAHGRTIAGPSTLRLALCTPPFLGNEQARASIAAFVGKNLGIETTVLLETGEKGMEGLRSSMYDALITVGSYDCEEVDCMVMGTVAPALLMRPNHPLARNRTVSVADVKPYPVALSKDFDNFNDSIVNMYRKRGVEMRLVDMDEDRLDDFFAYEDGLVFAAGIPALGMMHPNTVIRVVASEDAIAMPICLVSLKGRKSKAYGALERWLANELVLLGKDPIKRLAAVAVAPVPQEPRVLKRGE